MTEDYINKVIKIAQIKYDLNPEVVESFEKDIIVWYDQGFSPRKVVDIIADILFSEI